MIWFIETHGSGSAWEGWRHVEGGGAELLDAVRDLLVEKVGNAGRYGPEGIRVSKCGPDRWPGGPPVLVVELHFADSYTPTGEQLGAPCAECNRAPTEGDRQRFAAATYTPAELLAAERGGAWWCAACGEGLDSRAPGEQLGAEALARIAGRFSVGGA